jgi:transcriptional regulator with XRE-family HTH domain
LKTIEIPNILAIVLDLTSLGRQIAVRRKTLKLTQFALAKSAGVSRATLEGLENGRTGELGFSKVARLLVALGLELKLQTANSGRPTLDDLMQEDRNDKSLDRRH